MIAILYVSGMMRRMILGIGTDIVDIRRVEALLGRKGEQAIARLFSKEEAVYCDTAPDAKRRIVRYANRFAAKEATIKAISAFYASPSWQDIIVKRAGNGAPLLCLSEPLTQTIATSANVAASAVHTHISLSDEVPYSIAYVILSANAGQR